MRIPGRIHETGSCGKGVRIGVVKLGCAINGNGILATGDEDLSIIQHCSRMAVTVMHHCSHNREKCAEYGAVHLRGVENLKSIPPSGYENAPILQKSGGMAMTRFRHASRSGKSLVIRIVRFRQGAGNDISPTGYQDLTDQGICK